MSYIVNGFKVIGIECFRLICLFHPFFATNRPLSFLFLEHISHCDIDIRPNSQLLKILRYLSAV